MTTENEKLLFEAYKEARMTDEEARLSVLAADDCMVLCGGYIVVHDRLPIVTSVMELFHLYGAAHDTGKKVSDIIKDGGSRFLESYNLERFFSEWRAGDNGKMWLIPAKGQRLAYLVPGSEEDIRRAYGSMRAIELSESDDASYFQHRAEAETRFRLRLEKLLPEQKK